MTIRADKPLRDIFALPEFAPMKGQFIASASDWFAGGKEAMTLSDLGRIQPTWAAQDMAGGLSRLQQIAQRGNEYVFSFQKDNPARLIHLPADQKASDPFVLLLAGGAYGAVCTLVESLPVAARLNAMGYDCFCLNYRTATPESMVHGLMPAPLDDIANALRWIIEQYGPNPYLMAGFSAGGHACALWGTAHLGAQHYGLSQPVALLLDYPLNSLLSMPPSPVLDYLMQGLFGTGYNQSIAAEYAADRHIDLAYPPVWIEKAMDDDTIPAKDTEALCAALRNAHVPFFCEIVTSGGHGFGLGSNTPASGWVERSVSWVKGLNLKTEQEG